MMAIRVIDLETTGIDATDHVVEIGSVDLLQDGSITRHQDFLVHPPCPIPAEARAVHHISDEDVAQAKSWDAVCSTFFDRGNCSDLVAFAAHNAAFDQQWLPPDLLGNLPLVCTYKAAVHIWPDAPRHTNQVLRYWLNLDMDRSLADRAHRAMPDAYVTAHLLREIVKHASIEDLIRWTNEPVLLPKVTFGKYRGQTWTTVPPDYLQWILRQQDMNEDVAHTARHYLAKLQ
jgi:exodeoxyribonuclease X